MNKLKTKKSSLPSKPNNYKTLISDIAVLLEKSRKEVGRSVNAILTLTYWHIGRQIVEFEQDGQKRAAYGGHLIVRLSKDLSLKFGKGFSSDNLELMRLFYLSYNKKEISETLSRKSSGTSHLTVFPLSWSHYVLLLRKTNDAEIRNFYEQKALRCGWSVRDLDRQISTQFYERTLLSKNKISMLKKAEKNSEMIPADEIIKDPYILEFLNLKDEYSESTLEDALIQHLERFLLELGGDFTFVGRQKRLRIGTEWYRVDLLFFHRKLRCLVLIDLKVGKFTHADAGQMHLYLNYAREHWTLHDENPPIGMILCSAKDSALVKYSIEGLPHRIKVSEYKLALPQEKLLKQELMKTRKLLESRVKK